MIKISDIFRTSNDVYDITNIKDKFGFLRYSIIALNFDDRVFVLKVKEYSQSKIIPDEIIREQYIDKDELLAAYNKMVDDYTSVVRLMNKNDISAEDIFDDVVGYHIKFPKCCLNCRFSIMDCSKHFSRFNHLLCVNDKNMRTYNRLLKEHGMSCKMARNVKPVNPHVNTFGICKNYSEDKDKISTIMSMILENTMKNDEDFLKLKNHGIDFGNIKCRNV